MGTVKYTGPVASFHCPTEAEIRSLKVHFSPKQEGSGDPSPENIRPIVGWDGVEAYRNGKNLVNISNDNIIYQNFSKMTDGSYYQINGNTITLYNPNAKSLMVCFAVMPITSQMVGISFALNANTTGDGDYGIFLSDLDGNNRTSNRANPYTIASGDVGKLIGARVRMNNISGTYTVSNIQFEFGSNATNYESYKGVTTNYEFGVLGKNKFNWDVEQGHASPTTSDYMTARTYPLNTYIIGMSSSNYYRDNYTNWVLNPSVSNGTISFSSGGASGYGIGYPLKLAPNQTYFLSGETTNNGSVGAIYYDKDGALISTQVGRLNKTITVPSNTSITMIVFYAIAPNTSYTFSNIQLELGSTPTAYEPYNPNHTVYGGWVDLITGEVCEEQLIWTADDIDFHIGNSDSYNGESGKRFSAAWPIGSINDFSDDINTIAKCNILPTVVTTNSSSTAKAINWLSVYKGWGSNTIYGCLSDSVLNNDTSIENIKTYLKNNNFKVLIKLANSITYNLPPYSAELKTFLGQNNVWSNADYVEVEYDLHETQTLLARKAFIMANQPHIESASGAIASFKTDLRAPLKSAKFEFLPKTNISNFPTYWAPGEGKNLFHVTATSTSINGVDFTVCSDGAIEANGTANADVEFDLGTVTLNEGTYRINGGIRMNYASIKIRNKNTQCASTDAILTIDSTSETITPYIYIKNGYTIDRKFYPMIRDSSNTNGIFAPYSYVFPISGINEIDINIANSNIGFMNNYRLGTSTSWGTVRASYGDFTNDVTSACFVFPIKPGTYKVSCKNSDTYWVFRGIALEMKSLQFNEGTTSAFKGFEHWAWYTNKTSRLTSKTITIPAEADGLLIQVKMLEDNIAMTSELLSGLQFTCSPGTSDINFISSTLSTIPISWQSTAGTIYGGYVDIAKGELVQTYYKLVADGINLKVNSYYTNISDLIGGGIVYLNPTGTPALSSGPNGQPPNVFCDSIPLFTQGYIAYHPQEPPFATAVQGGKQYIIIYPGKLSEHPEVTDATTAKAFVNNWLQSNPVTIIYELVEPIVYQLTPQQLSTLRGQNNVWSNANNGNIKLKYWTH